MIVDSFGIIDVKSDMDEPKEVKTIDYCYRIHRVLL